MLVSTRGRYALRVMLELAQRPADSFTPLPVIAEAQSVSENIWRASWCCCPVRGWWTAFEARAAAIV